MNARRLVGPAFALGVIFLMTAVMVPGDRLRLDRLLALTAFGYVFTVARRQLGIGNRPRAVAPPLPGTGELSPADEQDVRIARLDASLARGAESDEQFSNVTRPMLRRLAAERLLMRSGVDVDADPPRARQLMGEELWEMFSTAGDQPVATPGPERLRVLVDRLETL